MWVIIIVVAIIIIVVWAASKDKSVTNSYNDENKLNAETTIDSHEKLANAVVRLIEYGDLWVIETKEYILEQLSKYGEVSVTAIDKFGHKERSPVPIKSNRIRSVEYNPCKIDNSITQEYIPDGIYQQKYLEDFHMFVDNSKGMIACGFVSLGRVSVIYKYSISDGVFIANSMNGDGVVLKQFITFTSNPMGFLLTPDNTYFIYVSPLIANETLEEQISK